MNDVQEKMFKKLIKQILEVTSHDRSLIDYGHHQAALARWRNRDLQ